MNTITVAQERFVQVAYPKTLKAAHKAFRSWHEPKRQDAVQECMAKMWDQWVRLRAGKEPRTITHGLIKYAILWVRYDRRLSGRAANIDVMDYRANMKQQQISSKGEVGPTDRSDKMNGWIDWTVKARPMIRLNSPQPLRNGDHSGRVGRRVGLIVTGGGIICRPAWSGETRLLVTPTKRM